MGTRTTSVTGRRYFSGERMFDYFASQAILLKEHKARVTQRKENAKWIRPSTDKHPTLVTCWPSETITTA